MTRTERLLRLAKLRGDRAAELIIGPAIPTSGVIMCVRCNEPARDCRHSPRWTEAELRAAWGDR